MKTVNIARLKSRLSLYLNEVKRGREILVRDRHTPVARIVPVLRNADSDDELLALAGEGKIRLGGPPLDERFWQLPAPRVPADALKRVLKRERDEA